MNVDELAAKYGLTNEWIEESAAAYERGDYPHEDGQVYSVPTSTQWQEARHRCLPVREGAESEPHSEEQGRKASEMYRDALAEYLDKYETVASR